VLHGTVMGDGNLAVNTGGKNAYLQLMHGIKQSVWLWWKFEHLRPLFKMEPRVVVKETRGKLHEAIDVSSRCHPILTELHELFYSRPTAECDKHVYHKAITPSVLGLFDADDLALMVWFCDDGSWDGWKRHTYIAVGAMTPVDYDQIFHWMLEKGWDPEMWKDPRENCVKYFIKNKDAFFSRVSRLIPECMQHKIK
jgi:hypothetical protein